MLIAWTTVATAGDADRLARLAVQERLAACAQIDGPLRSVYEWNGKLEQAEEFRLTFKCLPETSSTLEKRILAAHPYETPEWVVLQADHVTEKYLSWARTNSSSRPL